MSYARPLLATDLSPASESAARIAPFVLAPGAHGTVITVVERPDVPARVPRQMLDDLRAIAGERAGAAEAGLVGWAREQGLGEWRPIAFADGGVSSIIAREAERADADVVLLGDRGANRVERALLGSVARAVLHRADTDVLVARPRRDGPLRRLLVATDLQEPSARAAVRARMLAAASGAPVTLVHAIDPGHWAGALYPAPPAGRGDASLLRKHVAEGLAEFNAAHLAGEAEELMVEGRAAATLAGVAGETEADLVVTGTHGGGLVSRAILGSVAEALAERAPCSVLVVRR